jgi:hypothetical protein
MIGEPLMKQSRQRPTRGAKQEHSKPAVKHYHKNDEVNPSEWKDTTQ